MIAIVMMRRKPTVDGGDEPVWWLKVRINRTAEAWALWFNTHSLPAIFPEPRRIRDRDHVSFVAKQPCLVCGRQPSDAHHVRFAQSPALGRKVSDEFTVPLCRGHHREVHRCGDEPVWWLKVRINPMVKARALWLRTHPLPAGREVTRWSPGQ
jgi:hypothetical protein